MTIKLLLLLCLWRLFGAVSPLKWGIAGTGFLANRFVNAVSVLPKFDHDVVAVAARKLESAQNFARDYNISQAYEGYIHLAKDNNIDIVYVAEINLYRYDVTKIMLENGKHVLCEKSFTVNQNKTGELLNLAKQKKLFLMEGIWSRTLPVYNALRKILDSGELGEIKEVVARFGFNLSGVKSDESKEMGASVTLDLGIYPLQLVQFVYRGLNPLKILASGNLNEEGVDQTINAILSYPQGKRGIISMTTDVDLPSTAIISGSNGSISIPDFWEPTELIKNGVVEEFPLIENSVKFNLENSGELAYEVEEARDCIKKGKLESDKITHAETLQLSQIMDNLRKQVGAIEYL